MMSCGWKSGLLTWLVAVGVTGTVSIARAGDDVALTAEALVEADTLGVGGAMEVSLRLGHTGPDWLRVPIRGELAWFRCGFQHPDGREYTRPAYDIGMLRGPHPLVVQSDSACVLSFTVYLLSELGEYLPPATYDVTGFLDVGMSPHATGYSGEEWRGTIVSKPIRLTVVEEPSQIERIEVPVVMDTLFIEEFGQMRIWVRENAMQMVEIERRAGFHVGCMTAVNVVSGADTTRPFLVTGPCGQIGGMFSPDLTAMVRARHDTMICAHVEIFETSVPPQHLWSPEQGAFRVLWRGATCEVRAGSPRDF